MEVKIFGKAILFSLLLLSSAIFVSAQEFRGTITGNVTDPNGAIIPGANVVVKNVDTNVSVTIKASDEGSFTAPLLNPGKYSVTATAQGFKTSVQENINLTVGDRLTVDLKLAIGASAEVNVVADSEIVEKGSVTVGTLIDKKQIEELPSSEGAAYTLATQAPGTIYTGNPTFTGPTSNGNLAGFRTNGVGGNQITLDNSPNIAVDNGVAYTPPSDAVSQFKIQTSSFDAGNGFTAGSTVNVAVKSGTNKIHASGSYFGRNKALTANSFYSNKAGQTLIERQYFRLGGQVNGPVKLPFYNGKDRTFFMFSAEDQYTKTPTPTTISVPTAKMRVGDFSELLALSTPILIYDPATAFKSSSSSTCAPSATGTVICRTPFAGNIIPAARLNAAALKFLSLYPTPNLPGLTNNYFTNQTNILPYKTILTRIDHSINDQNKIFGKFFWSTQRDDKYNLLETADALTRGFETRGNLGGNADWTATLQPTLILDVRSNYNSFSQLRVPTVPTSPAALGFAGIAAISNSTEFPRFNFTNFDTFGAQRSDYNEGYDRYFSEFSLQPNFTQIAGNHTLRYGYDYRRLMESKAGNGYNAGNYTTTGTYTMWNSSSGSSSTTGSAAVGRDLASFLLGDITSGTIEQTPGYKVNMDYHAFFFQDDWRVNRKLSLNLGLRYEVESGVKEQTGRLITGFNPTATNPLGAAALANYNASVPLGISINSFQTLLGGLEFADSGKKPNQAADYGNLQPRFGVAYSLNDKTVIRAGGGIFTSPFSLQPITQTGFTATTSFLASSNNGLNFVGTLDNPFPTGLNPATGSTYGLTTSIGNSLGTTGSTGPSASILSYERKNANYARAMIGVQREMPYKIGLEANLIYSHGYHLPVLRQSNYIPAQNLNNFGTSTDGSIIFPAITATTTFLTATVANPFRGLVPTNSTWNAATLARYRLITQYPQFQDLVTTEFNGTSDYAALQLQATKRFSSGFSLNSSYTFNYDHEKTRRLNPQDANLQDQISTSSRPHRFTLSAIYELPFGRKRLIGNNWNPIVDGIFGGWQLQTIYEVQSGEPLVFGNVFYSGDPTKLVNKLGKRDSNGLRYGVDVPAFDTSGFFLLNPATSSLAVPGYGSFATSSQTTLRTMPFTLNNFRNQMFQKFDIGMSKNFKIGENMKLQLRVDALNAANWVYFSGLGLSPALNSTTFAYANAQRNLPRDIQYGARFSF